MAGSKAFARGVRVNGQPCSRAATSKRTIYTRIITRCVWRTCDIYWTWYLGFETVTAFLIITSKWVYQMVTRHRSCLKKRPLPRTKEMVATCYSKLQLFHIGKSASNHVFLAKFTGGPGVQWRQGRKVCRKRRERNQRCCWVFKLFICWGIWVPWQIWFRLFQGCRNKANAELPWSENVRFRATVLVM